MQPFAKILVILLAPPYNFSPADTLVTTFAGVSLVAGALMACALHRFAGKALSALCVR